MTDLERLLSAMMQAQGKTTTADDHAKQCAEKTYELYNEFVKSGFDEEQAFELLTIILRKEI